MTVKQVFQQGFWENGEKLRHSGDVLRETSWGGLGLWYFRHIQPGRDPEADSGRHKRIWRNVQGENFAIKTK